MRLAADANVLLSAILGGRARLILESPRVQEFLTVEPIIVEVQEYATHLGHKRGLAEDLVLLAAGALPVTIVGQASYKEAISEAVKRIGERDPDDVELLAMAMALHVPVWSNDKDFARCGVEWLTTEALLQRFDLIDQP